MKYIYTATTKCINCNKECIKRVGNNKSNIEILNKRKSFCSKECRKQYNFNNRKDLINTCSICGSKFRLKSTADSKIYCSRKCYTKWQSINIKPPQSENRRIKANSVKAIEKRKKTWEITGRIFNFKENKDWKRFWRKCNELTRKIRKEMIPEWDGYDYYDGEYIKDNLKLDTYHKNYPTLDHIYPRSKAFLDGKTPQEITVKENLVWTKRTNNSKKGNKIIVAK
jgi:hypothetical protein